MRRSEIAVGVGVVCLLLALLTWLLARGVASDAAAYSMTLRILDDFALAEASLERDGCRLGRGCSRTMTRSCARQTRETPRSHDFACRLRRKGWTRGLSIALPLRSKLKRR
jgi:hypothetical protein